MAKRLALYVLALLVFALATYARISWYGQETLEKRYLVKSVKLMEARAKVVIEAQIPAAPRPLLVRPEPAEPVIVLPHIPITPVVSIYQPTFFRPPPPLVV